MRKFTTPLLLASVLFEVTAAADTYSTSTLCALKKDKKDKKDGKKDKKEGKKGQKKRRIPKRTERRIP